MKIPVSDTKSKCTGIVALFSKIMSLKNMKREPLYVNIEFKTLKNESF